MNPREFQNLASQLVKDTSPVALRTAVNRSYYAAYNVGVEFLEGMNFRITKGTKGHDEVQKYLNYSGDNNIISLASKLVNLYSERIRADYRLDNRNVENLKNVSLLVKQAEEMIQALDACISSAKRTQITHSIQENLRKVRNPQ